ncbi:MAG: YHS domain-containing protein [Alphaproteobacteria bacterium]|nr:YHS domain-containing protein [Alphaproteobacteria bacterium]
MAELERTEWYDLARTTSWTPKYVKEEEFFPPEMSDPYGMPQEVWDTYDEPYKTTYRDYVRVQRDKDIGVYSVRAALGRSHFVEKAPRGWLSILKSHYGIIASVEFTAAIYNCRNARFGRAGGMRNTGTFGILDEIRHGQLEFIFPHEYLKNDRQWDWAVKTYHTDNWTAIAGRHFIEDVMVTRDAVSSTLMNGFCLETGYTNVQFISMAADAAKMGDYTFSNVVTSIQTDEARHAQIGAPNVRFLVETGHKDEAQYVLDNAFWRSWKLFLTLTGPAIDYFTPLEKREKSFKEFMEEWIIAQYRRQIDDMGIDEPWYWDIFLDELNYAHHGLHMGLWRYRPTLFWDPKAGVTPPEREWLEEKYPGWNDTFGKSWDVVIENLKNGEVEKTLPLTLPMLCNICQLPFVAPPNRKTKDFKLHDHTLEHNGRLYHFCSKPCKWIFETETDRYQEHKTLIDRFLAGEIQPMTIPGVLAYMGVAPGEMGDDADKYTWVDAYRDVKAAQ